MKRDLAIAILGSGSAAGAMADALRAAGFTHVRSVENKLLALAQTAGEVTLAYTDGTTDHATVLIAADDAVTSVRDIIFGWGSASAGRVEGRIALVSDAGAAAALARALASAQDDDVEAALKRYESETQQP